MARESRGQVFDSRRTVKALCSSHLFDPEGVFLLDCDHFSIGFPSSSSVRQLSSPSRTQDPCPAGAFLLEELREGGSQQSLQPDSSLYEGSRGEMQASGNDRRKQPLRSGCSPHWRVDLPHHLISHWAMRQGQEGDCLLVRTLGSQSGLVFLMTESPLRLTP